MTTDTQLPEYVYFKPVQAGRIVKIEPPAVPGARIAHLYLEVAGKPGSFIRQPVHDSYLAMCKNEVGGWFLREANGSVGYRSAAAFEADFARVPDLQPVSPEQLADIELLAGQQWTQSAPELEQMPSMRNGHPAESIAFMTSPSRWLVRFQNLEPPGAIAECKAFRHSVLGDTSKGRG